MPISKLKASSIASGIIDNARISLDAAEIPSLPTSKITSGTFDDARIAASNVSQHATSFDDNKLVNDLSTLGLRVHTQENLSASNTNSQYVDVFQDDSGYTNGADTARNASEYVSTVSESVGSNANVDSHFNGDNDRTTPGMPGQHGPQYNSGRLWDGTSTGSHSSVGMAYWGDTAYSSKPGTPHQFTTINYSNNVSGVHPMILDFVANGGSNYAIIPGSYVRWYSFQTHGRVNGHYWMYQDTNDTWHFWNGDGRDNLSGTWTDGSVLNAGNSDGWYGIQHPSNGSTIAVKRLAMITTSHHVNSNGYPGISELETNFATYSLTANATGNFTCPNITAASATTKMGAVITYQDNAGTNALNTDIVLQLSADGGSNYSTATLTALPDFSTGIKMAKVNDLTVTSGTSLKYKILFANQAAGSKEARIRGVSLNY